MIFARALDSGKSLFKTIEDGNIKGDQDRMLQTEKVRTR